MSTDETASELAKLRAELAALQEVQRQPPAAPPPQETTANESSDKDDSARAETTADVPPEDEEVTSQLDELATLLEHEIRDLPTITCLAVFSLGILMGRLLR